MSSSTTGYRSRVDPIVPFRHLRPDSFSLVTPKVLDLDPDNIPDRLASRAARYNEHFLT